MQSGTIFQLNQYATDLAKIHNRGLLLCRLSPPTGKVKIEEIFTGNGVKVLFEETAF